MTTKLSGPQVAEVSQAMDIYRQTPLMLQRDYVVPGYSYQVEDKAFRHNFP